MTTIDNQGHVPFSIFITYAQEDDESRDRIERHLSLLKREEDVVFWYSQKTDAGAEKLQERNRQLKQARVILLLISPDFVSSERCYEELQEAARCHESGSARVIPILLRKVDNWEKLRFGKITLGDLQHVPPHDRSVQEIAPRDEAYRQVAEGIRQVVVPLLANAETASKPFQKEQESPQVQQVQKSQRKKRATRRATTTYHIKNSGQMAVGPHSQMINYENRRSE
jgi:hypothetical protein